MIEPCSRSTIETPTSFMRCHAAVRLSSIIFAKSSSDSFSIDVAFTAPALLTRMSTGPSRDSISVTRVSRSSAFVRSQGKPWMFGILDSSSTSRSVRRAVMATVAPAAASTRAIRFPSPDDAPVTSATRPVRSNSSAGVLTSSGIVQARTAAS